MISSWPLSRRAARVAFSAAPSPANQRRKKTDSIQVKRMRGWPGRNLSISPSAPSVSAPYASTVFSHPSAPSPASLPGSWWGEGKGTGVHVAVGDDEDFEGGFGGLDGLEGGPKVLVLRQPLPQVPRLEVSVV